MRTSSKVGYETIIRAIQQDEQALLEILLQYRQEIQMLSMREIVDDTGRRYQCPDEDMSCDGIMGYRMGENREWLIEPEQARVIKLIDMAFLSGMSLGQIKKLLESNGIKSPRGVDTWQTGTIKRLLKSEKYLGDVLLQKTFVENALTHKARPNRGELPQYYVKDHHPAIRSREIGYLIKAEFARRNAMTSKDTTKNIRKGRYNGLYALSTLLVCGECGTLYRRVTWSKNGRKKIVWRCINRLTNGPEFCKHSPSLEEGQLHDAILRAMNHYIDNRDELRWLLKESINEAVKAEPSNRIEEIEEQIQSLEQSVLNLAELLSMSSAEVDYFDTKLKELEEQLKGLYNQKQDISIISKENLVFENVDEELLNFIDSQEIDLQRYNDMLVRKIVKKIVVVQHDKIEVTFMDGKKVEALVRKQ